MKRRKNILVLIGSASAGSSSEKLAQYFEAQTKSVFTVDLYNALKSLPHFDPRAAVADPPEAVISLRKKIEEAEGILICTPEYVFSIPSGLKNAIEWCVSTTVFSDKSVGLITASASGTKGHEELKLIMQTVGASFTEATTLLIQGVRGKLDGEGQITDAGTQKAVEQFIEAFKKRMSHD
ncbi:NADPH-dependent FMN reductase [Niabella hirudinis]|uniref:NADPH-dependent FMN reductase n=1 Tax=Niabella hirudinis TaxID=1285929 RepID=UPI003EBD633A